MENYKIKISELNVKLQELINKTNALLKETNNLELEKSLNTELKDLESRANLKISFVGQYSSGKSTIISAITGDKSIKIDADVATDKVTEYQWKNIILMDTPGILAGKVEKHDERTKEALKNSDLIVYVLTSQLFDDIIFENFIDLAYNQRLKDKMLIAVNKMSMENGDIDELTKNYYNSIKTIFKERNYEFDFEIVFIDAADYIEGQDDQDEEFIQLSNFNTFLKTLNSFIEKKGIIKKQFDSPIRLLKNSIANITISQTDPNIQIVLKQSINRIDKAKQDIQSKINITLSNLKSKIINDGNKLIDLIGDSDQKTFENAEKEFEENTEKNIKNVIDQCKKILEDEEKEIIEEFDVFGNKDSIKNLENVINQKLKTGNLNVKELNNLEKQKKIINFLSNKSQGIAQSAINNSGLSGLKAVSGSEMHKTVYSVGKFFGSKFKPYGAVKIAGNIGKIAKFIGPALSLATIWLDVKENNDAEKRRKEILKLKNKLSVEIAEYAEKCINDIQADINDYIKNNYDEKIKDLNQSIIELIKTDSNNSELSKKIDKLNSDYIDFIEIIEEE